MWMTPARRKWTMASPSVWAGGTWKALTSSPLICRVTASLKVTTGSAFAGEGGNFMPIASMNCSVLRRRRTLSWATMRAPASPRSLFPPEWSGCQWVLRMKRTGRSLIAATAALTLGVMGAHSSSTRKTPSAPAETPMLPPAPASTQTPSATFSVLIWTFSKSGPCALEGAASAATSNIGTATTTRRLINARRGGRSPSGLGGP